MIPTGLLDIFRSGRIFASVSRWLKAASLLLLAVWLPATLHCRLESAGLIAPHHEECEDDAGRGTATDCKDDACPTVEETLIKDSSTDLVVSAPADCTCALCVAALLCACDGCAEPALSPARHAPPPGLTVAWQFLLRAAPLARAPSLNTNRA